MHRADCIVCATLAGARRPPGGMLYEDACWAFFLRARPLLAPGQGFIALKRHCERLSDLRPDEAHTLGPMLQRVEAALTHVLTPARVHFGIYGEAAPHLHVHVVPRMPNMPAGNIPISILHAWYDVLSRLRLRQGYSDEAVVAVAQRLRAKLQSMAA